ncbi:MAG TPA: pantoate--beta-alanine ligase [Actinomycetota bacterium]|nr:pantoate--beta-alanine ligase [Actinomycetota bacterium]
MQVVSTIAELRTAVAGARRRGSSIHFVPTMGALHEGHLSLMRAARDKGDFLAVSIFVNPLQFGPAEDFDTYPRDLRGDLVKAEAGGADLVFAPAVSEMYPRGEMQTRIDVGRLGEVLEGAFRPGHFAGVATVCAKLFNLVAADRVYLGRKDAQQVAVLQQMVRDLEMAVEIVPCPTVREPDGLAMSSRNQRLDPEGRRAAPAIYRALQAAEAAAATGPVSAEEVARAARRVLAEQPAVRLQYLEVVDPDTFEPVESVSQPALVVVAAHAGPVRLIDNVIVGTV